MFGGLRSAIAVVFKKGLSFWIRVGLCLLRLSLGLSASGLVLWGPILYQNDFKLQGFPNSMFKRNSGSVKSPLSTKNFRISQ